MVTNTSMARMANALWLNLTFSALVETTSDASFSFLVSWASFIPSEEQEKCFLRISSIVSSTHVV